MNFYILDAEMPDIMENLEINDEAFVRNPSKMTGHILSIINRLSLEQLKAFHTKQIVNKFISDIKINLYLKEGYLEFYRDLNAYKVPIFTDRKIYLLIKEFSRFYKKIIFHNFALAYYYARNSQISIFLFTAEDRKIKYFKDLYNNQIGINQFNTEFGHYALNAFELSERRFEEYREEELLAVAKLVADFKIDEKRSIEEYIAVGKNNVMPILIALRELAKYKILFLVRDIRYELLRIADNNKIDNIFDKAFDEIFKEDKIV